MLLRINRSLPLLGAKLANTPTAVRQRHLLVPTSDLPRSKTQQTSTEARDSTRGLSPILLSPRENCRPHVAGLHSNRYSLLQTGADLVLLTMIVLRARHLRVRYCGHMTASVTGTENHSMRLSGLMSETDAGA